MAINFIFSKETDEERIIHSKSGIMIYDKIDEVIEEHFPSLFLDIKLSCKSKKGIDFSFSCVITLT